MVPNRTFLKKAWLACWVVVVLLAFPAASLAQTTIDLVVHYVQGQPAEDKIAYQVSVYLSVVDSSGTPIKDLTAENFTVAEDSQQVEIDSLELARDEPINIVLLLDTSGSMRGSGIQAARRAASNFIAGLESDDRVAVLNFDDEVHTVVDFTTDHNAARQQVELVDAKANAGTCLYDAAYQAAQMTASLPAGRRAIVLLTDGVDETRSGGVCSTHTLDDVINLASSGGTRVPIYTLGMGSRIDEKTLARMADLTGGRALYSPDASQLEALFLRLADHLRSQYNLRYTSHAGPGAHTLAVSVNYLDARDDDTRSFLLPAMPTRLAFEGLTDGQQVSGSQQLKVSVFGQGEPVARLVLELNGEVIASDDTTPYEFSVDFDAFPAGEAKLRAVAYGADDTELAAQSIAVDVLPAPTLTPTPVPPTATPAAAPTTGAIKSTPVAAGAETREINWVLVGGLGVVGLLILAVIIWALVKRRREEQAREEAWQSAQSLPDEGGALASGDDRTIDDWEIAPDAWGMLIVEASDDPSMVGQRFEITQSVTTLGRRADNDIIFPKDSPVSRYHARIEERNGGLFLIEVETPSKDGSLKRPTFGTYVNGEKLGIDPVLLQDGDEIRLGKRVRLRFQAGKKTAMMDEMTYDGFLPEDDDPEKTRDG